eukprot:gene48237-biopygen82621
MNTQYTVDSFNVGPCYSSITGTREDNWPLCSASGTATRTLEYSSCQKGQAVETAVSCTGGGNASSEDCPAPPAAADCANGGVRLTSVTNSWGGCGFYRTLWN